MIPQANNKDFFPSTKASKVVFALYLLISRSDFTLSSFDLLIDFCLLEWSTIYRPIEKFLVLCFFLVCLSNIGLARLTITHQRFATGLVVYLLNVNARCFPLFSSLNWFDVPIYHISFRLFNRNVIFFSESCDQL